MKLIDKDTLLVEIDKRKIGYNTDGKHTVEYNTVKKILDILDSLEVKGVDLEKEIKEDWLFADKTEVDCLESMCLTEDMFVSLAKKYFELCLKAQKGE